MTTKTVFSLFTFLPLLIFSPYHFNQITLLTRIIQRQISTQKRKKPRTQDSSASSSSTSSAASPQPPWPTEIRDVFTTTDNKLKRLNARVTLIEVLHKEFQNLCNSLEHSQHEIDSLGQENKSLHQSVSSMSAQLCSVTSWPLSLPKAKS